MQIKCFLFFVLLINCCYAQHCPFDGANIVALKITDKKGNFISGKKRAFYLKEVKGTLYDSCMYENEQIIEKAISKQELIKVYKEKYKQNNYYKKLLERLDKIGVTIKANYFILLTSAQETCTTIEPSNSPYTNYKYIKRKFVVEYTQKGKTVTKPLSIDEVFSLCTASKDLENFTPLEIIL